MQAIKIPELIDKELIPSLTFYNREKVKQAPDLIKTIERASLLGNSQRVKVKIIFEDDISLKCVETTIWAAGMKYICLKGGIWIPIDRIVDIKI